jgi:hypothetical protein
MPSPGASVLARATIIWTPVAHVAEEEFPVLICRGNLLLKAGDARHIVDRHVASHSDNVLSRPSAYIDKSKMKDRIENKFCRHVLYIPKVNWYKSWTVWSDS